MQPTRTPDGVRVGADAKQRLHDARGYGRAVDEGVVLSPVEAAYLLYRGDIPPVEGDGFPAFVRDVGGRDFLVRFLAYKDLRERGFYLRAAHPSLDRTTADFVVFERGSDPHGDDVAYEVRVVDERAAVAVGSLAPGVLAIVDEEGEIGYVAVGTPTLSGSADQPTDVTAAANLIGDRAIVWEPPDRLYRTWFFGQPIAGREDFDAPLQLSLVEAAYLAGRGVLDLDDSRETIARRGRRLEGAQFDRRLHVYAALRTAGIVPKTGYKFGTDFRLYRSFHSIDRMEHSGDLVRVRHPDTEVAPAAIALDVRLAHGVGKRMVFALTTGNSDTSITWLSIERLTP